MKKILSLVLASAMVLSLAACGKKDEPSKSGSQSTSTSKSEQTQYTQGQFKLKLGTVTSGTHSWVQTANWMKEQLAERSNGAIELSVYEGGQLGNDEAEFTDMGLGTQDMMIGGLTSISSFIPETTAMILPYLYPSRDVYESTLTVGGPVFNYVQGKFDEYNFGVKLLGMCNSGARYLFSVKQVSSLADLKGMKMRITTNVTDNDIWSALGTLPTAMGFNDIYNAAQSHTVDAFECTLGSYQSSALYEVAPYMAVTQHQYTPSHISISTMTWDKLPADIQEILAQVCEEAGEYCNKITDEAEDSLIETLAADHGVTVTEVDKSEFQTAIEPVYSKILETCKGQDLYEILKQEINK